MGEVRSGERRVSTADLQRRAQQAAAGFAALGIGAGDTVALFLRNDLPLFEASFGAALLGAYPVAMNWHATADEARYVFEDCGARAVVIHADLLAGVAAAIPHSAVVIVVPTPPEIRTAYGLDPSACEPAPAVRLWEVWRDSHPPGAPQPVEPPSSIIYTSGTTGRPKGVRRHPPTPAQTEATLQNMKLGFGFGSQDPADIVTVVTGPMYHSAPNAYGLSAARLGATVILQPRFDAEGLLRLIAQERVTHLHMAPIMFNRLLALPPEVRERYDLSSLRFVVHAAAPCPPEVKRAMIAWWGPVINEYYGSTEVGILTFITSAEALERPGSVGRAIPGAEVRILDEDGRALPQGGVGEVAGRSAAVADFTYHGDDAKRARAARGALVAPGDVGRMDEDGYLFLCDRSHDMIISGGVNIYPAEIEAELHALRGVADCAVFGVPDEEYGEAVHAVIQLRPDADLKADDIREALRARIAGYKVPRTITFADDLPREDSGKIFKRRLRDPYWAGRGRRI